MNADPEIEVSSSVDHLFRRHSGQMVAVLCRIFGFEKIDLVEDAVQDAMVAAMKKWPFAGVPQNPRAWLIEVAKNRLLDRVRKDSKSVSADDLQIACELEGLDLLRFDGELTEDQLRMIFACCHPAIPADSQVALTLKTIGGFGTREIASAFLAKPDTVAKMLTRAKKTLRENAVQLSIPAAGELSARLDAVLKVLYLMFNEGYNASGGGDLVRKDLCFEAIRLCELLAEHPATTAPKVHAAAALFFFQASRLPARADHSGELVLLADQDRSLWDRTLIGRGLHHFRLSARGSELSSFHLEAEIAAHYSLSEDFEAIDWRRILECYDLLQQRQFSKVVELNRIVVLGKIDGPAAALAELDRLVANHEIEAYNLLHITRAHFLAQTGRSDKARQCYLRALELTDNRAIRRFLERRLEQIEQ